MARRKVAFRLIERAAIPPVGSRAKALQPRSLEILNDFGIAEELMQKGSTELPFKKFAGNQLIGVIPRSVFPRDDTRYPKSLLLPQWMVEEALRNKLKELGGEIEWSTELTDVVTGRNDVTCRLETPRGTEDVVCTYLAACDGGKSATRKKLGINFVGETHEEEQLWVGDVEVDGLTPDGWYNWLSPKFGLAFALFPFKGTKSWQIQAVVPIGEDGKVPAPTLEGFNALFRERTQMEGVTITSSTWQSIYRVNVRRADRYRVGNAFIAGDVAHVHSIAGGMGMNTGIQDAYNLGWKLAAVIRGEAGPGILDTYAEERIPIADWLLATTSERQKVTMSAAVSGAGSMDKIATKDTTQLDLNYRGRSLNGKGQATSSCLQPGDRAPDAKLMDGSWLSDQLRGTQWKALAFSGAPVMRREYLKVVEADDPALARAYGVSGGVVLIRPDHHVALFARTGNEVESYFDQLITGTETSLRD
jgi:2-polyprenyl-6-methoxyphenol hydroxylase-like FAD-dependent oxidoreductase